MLLHIVLLDAIPEMKKSSSTISTAILSSLLFFLALPSLYLAARAEPCNAEDQKTLLEIKAALNNPDELASWNPNTDCCRWHALACDQNTGRIIALGIFHGNISGHIPPAVGSLSSLQVLVLRKIPDLRGEIPSTISKLNNLSFLRISYTNLSGPVPSFLSQLKNLGVLDLSHNNLKGSIPPSLSQLPRLFSLHLEYNKLTGSIPDSFGRFAGTFTDLFLSHNLLTGPVPKSFGNLEFRFRIDLSRNMLEGDASFLFGKDKSIMSLDLSRNLFAFNLSKIEFPDSLVNLDLSHNNIFGRLPEGLAELNLGGLNVSYNSLCGQIPRGGKLQSFGYLTYFNNRCLCGAPLPACN
nr:polygalacturonase inhibitor-like [Coffea arabica]